MKALAGQTAIYGVSSILGRMINFLLVPLQTAVLSQSAYGINVDFYSLIAFLIVVVTIYIYHNIRYYIIIIILVSSFWLSSFIPALLS